MCFFDFFSFFSNDIEGGGFITFGYRHRKQIFLGIVLFLLVIGIGVGCFFYFSNRDLEDELEIEEAPKKKKEMEEISKDGTEKGEEEVFYTVDIKGEIYSPGIYSMPIHSRVIDVVEKAGGFTENADTSVINLSKRIVDEMVIIIYSHEQVENFYEVKQREEEVLDKCRLGDGTSLGNDACIGSVEVSSGKVHINTGSKSELMLLPGIGEAKAEEIIRYRESNGFFQRIEDIAKVSGIGDSLFEKIKDSITV